MRIYVTGFMGSGKTTVGRCLAETLGVPLVDLDERIEAEAGRSVREIFADEGEPGFRRRETRALRETMELDEVVVATGGGTLTVDSNVEFIARSGISVWLNLPFDGVVKRLGGVGREDRPLFETETQAWALYRGRLPAYQSCDVKVDLAVDEAADEVAARIVLLLGQLS